MATYLEGIVAHHRARAAADRRSREELEAAVAVAPPVRPFGEALRAGAGVNGLAVIAEIKRRSPSAGELAPGLDPARLGSDYARGGASCLSVLTDGPHFGGSAEDLARARAASGLAVLRKDFTVTAADCYDARSMGADAILLIVAALEAKELAELFVLAGRLGLTPLVEVHDRLELDRALDLGAGVIGVNQRDLSSFTVDPERAVSLAEAIPPEVLGVAESGIRTTADAVRLADAGFRAILVGEAFVTAPDPALAVEAFATVRATSRLEA